MLALIIVLLLSAAVTAFVLMKKGKVADVNNNNIPDVIEKPIEAVKKAVVEVKKEAKAKKPTTKKKPATKKAKKEQK